MSNISSYIKKRNKLLENQNLHFFGSINVFIKDSFPEDVSLKYVLNKIESLLPSYYVNNIDAVYIGQFDDFLERKTNAAYKDGALYITNQQDNEEDMIDDIIHEIAHAVEELAGEEIYGDDKVEVEFLGKRRRLKSILQNENYDIQRYNFLNSQYSEEFDIFLYKDIGYSLLTSLTMGLFISPYAATSLREYFARGFEEYYLNDRKYLTNVSPMLYNKIEHLDNIK